MTIKKNHIPLVMQIILCILLAILICTLFFKKSDASFQVEMAKEALKAKDAEIKAIEGQRDILKEWKNQESEKVAKAEKRDSILLTQQKTNKVIYEKIPATVNALSDDELRRAILERYPD